jgi:hypothetical protein
MDIRHGIDIAAPVGTVFALYAEPRRWPEWDSETVAVELSALLPGEAGWLTPRKGPRARVRVSEVVPDRSFTVEAALPLCRMRFGHELDARQGWTRATHWVDFTGLLAFVFRRLVGRGIDATLPATLAGLKAAAERRAGQAA